MNAKIPQIINVPPFFSDQYGQRYCEVLPNYGTNVFALKIFLFFRKDALMQLKNSLGGY